MKIGIICSKPPVPVIDGGNFATKSLIELLAQNNQIDSLVIETEKHPITTEFKTFAANFFQTVSTVKIDTRLQLVQLVKNLIFGKSYHLSRFTNNAFRIKLDQFLSNELDYLIVDSLFSATELSRIKKLFKGKIILRSHNLEHEIWERNIETESNFLKKYVLKKLIKSLRKAEIELFSKVDEIWSISEKDRISIQKLCSTKTLTIPVGLTILSQFTKNAHISAYHLGGMNWKPNELAVQYLTNEIWRNDFSVPLKLAGNGTEKLNQSSSQYIEFLGRVENLEHFYSQVHILVAPIYSGSGIRIKILEALAHGIPCITTEIGAEGIDIVKSGLQLADSPESFRKILNFFVQNPEELELLSERALKYMKIFHSNEMVLNTIQLQLNGK